ncbi:MAG: lipopolysaccharide biosynthesis protein [Rhodanobacter sp.]
MKGPIARGTIRTTFILGLYTLVQAGTLLLVARMLGPYQFGAFAGVASLAVLLGTLSPFGTNVMLLGEVAKEPTRRNQLLAYAIPTTLICGSALLVIYLTVCMLVLHAAQIPATVLLAIGVTEIWMQALFRLTVSEHQGLGRIARSQLLKTLPMVLRLVAAASVFLVRPPNPLLAYGYAYPVASLLALVLAVRTFPSAWPTPHQWRLPSIRELRNNAGYAALTISASGPGELDKTLAAKLLPLPVAGLYAVGTRIIAATTLPVSAMMESALPRLFREGSEQPKRTSKLLFWLFSAAFAYSLAIAIVLWLVAPVFDWVFGAKYQGLDHTLRWLCLALPGMALRMSVGNVLMALGRPWIRVTLEVFGLMLLIIMATTLTVLFGEKGMPLALACSEWPMAAIGWIYLRRHQSMNTQI